jgi:hypothetical protein
VFVDCQLGLEEGKMKRSTKPERMDEPFSFKLDDRSHQSCVLHELGGNARVMSKLLRSGLLKKCAQADGTFTPLSLVLFSSAGCKSAEAITGLCAGARVTRVTPFGLIRLPVVGGAGAGFCAKAVISL